MASYANKSRQDASLKIGDYVLLHHDAYFTEGRYNETRHI